jgi:hypothetical protein
MTPMLTARQRSALNPCYSSSTSAWAFPKDAASGGGARRIAGLLAAIGSADTGIPKQYLFFYAA